MNVQGKNILVLGLGVSGLAAAQLLLKHGARVTVRDESGDATLQERGRSLYTLGAQVESRVPFVSAENFDLAVVSPGIASNAPIMADVKATGLETMSELELGWRFCRCPVIGITGTNGKTTTTELVAGILKEAGKRVVAAGNIGVAFCEAVELTDQLDAVVLEVSSFQLEAIRKFRPQVSVMLNITPDHLDRYASMHEYALAKARIYQNQTASDFAVINAATLPQLESLGVKMAARPITFGSNAGAKADLWLQDGVIHGRLGYLRGTLFAMSETKLRGPHNAENAMAALAVGSVFAVRREAMTNAIKKYEVQPHRMEFVAEIGGVTFINDSKATNLDAVEKALATIDAPVVLIAGGKDKGFDFTSLLPLLKQKVKQAVLIGETRGKLAKAWSDCVPCVEAQTLRQAVWQAVAASKPGDVVLLGPACSSFDMFQSYADRGEQFKRLVQEFLISSEAKSERRTENSGETEEHAPLPIGAHD